MRLKLLILFVVLGGLSASAQSPVTNSLDGQAPRRVKPSPRVETFYDVLQHLCNHKYRSVNVQNYEWKRSKVIQYRYPCNLNDEYVSYYYQSLAREVDRLELVDYKCDTIHITEAWSDTYFGPWQFITSTETFVATFHSHKGLYNFSKQDENWVLSQVVFDPEYCSDERRALEAEWCRKHTPEDDVWFGGYDHMMLYYTCWDDKKLLRNYGSVSGINRDLIRIIIHDNRIVYCDTWNW
jgi:hypothetical protein